MAVNTQFKPKFIFLEPEFYSEFEPQLFETFAKAIAAKLSSEYEFISTPYTDDGGKDFFSKKIDNAIHTIKNNIGKVYGEAKRHRTLTPTSLSRTCIGAIISDECTDVIAVTSAKLNMSAYVETLEALEKNNIRFHMVHCVTLTAAICNFKDIAELFEIKDLAHQKNIDIDSILEQQIPPVIAHFIFWIKDKEGNRKRIKGVLTDGDTKSITLKPNETLCVQLLADNLSSSLRDIKLSLNQTQDWLSVNIPRGSSFVLTPYSSKLFSFELSLAAGTRASFPSIQLHTETRIDSIGSTEITINMDGYSAEPFFKVPLFGNKSLQTVQNIKKEIKKFKDHNENRPVLLEGAAGVGKTRVCEEVFDSEHTEALFRMKIAPGDNLEVIKEKIIVILKEHCGPASRIKMKNKLSREARLTSSELASIFDSPFVSPIILLIEDFHHASPDIVDWLTSVLHSDTKATRKLIISYRNDDTFPNPALERAVADYCELNSDIVCQYQLEPLKDSETKALINSIFSGISIPALEKIHSLSENIPFNLLQIIEYLCDEKIAEIHSRTSYSIINHEQFYTKDDFPKDIKSLFKKRLINLNLYNNSKLSHFLTAIALCNKAIDEEIIEVLLKKFSITIEDFQILYSRKYIASQDGLIDFTHENIKYFLLSSDVNTASNLEFAAKAFSDLPDILSTLSIGNKARIYFYGKEFSQLMEIVNDTAKDQDVTSLSIRNNFDQSITILSLGERYLLTENSKDKNIELLLDILFLRAFLSKFTKNYHVTIRMVDESIKHIEHILGDLEIPNSNAYRVKTIKLKQMKAHALQNTGFIHECAKLMSNLQLEMKRYLQDSAIDSFDLTFDFYDRAKKNYMYMAEKENALHCLYISQTIVEENNKQFLLSVSKLGEAELYFVSNPSKAFEIWRSNYQRIDTYADERIKLTNRLIMAQEAILRESEPYSTTITELKKIHHAAERQKLVGPQPKTFFLIGVSAMKHSNWSLAKKYFTKSYDKAESTGYGVFLWLSANNRAICEIELGNNEQAFNDFQTALQIANKLGFTKYLGESDVMFFQRVLIFNILKFSKENNFPTLVDSVIKFAGENVVIEFGKNNFGKCADDLFILKDGYYFVSYI